jgi:adenylate cyclase
VVGDSINTASRIQELNKRLHTRLLASETVTHNLEGWLTRRVCLFLAKGKETGLEIHEIFGTNTLTDNGNHKLCELFTAAMATLEAAQWSRAAEMFAAILVTYPADGPSLFYLDRCRTYLVSPPAAGQQTTIDDRLPRNRLN